MSATQYIATFFTHFDAIQFENHLKKQGVAAQLAPVPRKLSSSCGTCVRFTSETDVPAFDCENVEQLARIDNDAFVTILDHR